MKAWKTLIITFAVISICSILIGCTAAIRGFPDRPRISDATHPDPDYLLGRDALRKYNEETDVLKKKILRNETIDARIEEIDQKFGDFERELYKQGVGSGIGTDWTVLALTASTAVVGGASTKAALGAVSAGVVGAKASFDKRALFDAALPALISQMVAQRETIRASIRANQELPVEGYSIYAALSDLQRMEFSGSIPGSLQTIAEDAGQKANVAKETLKDIRNATYIKTVSGDLIRTYWKPDGKTIDTANEAKLKSWMTENGLTTDAGAVTMFLRSDVLEEARIKAVRDLGLNNK